MNKNTVTYLVEYFANNNIVMSEYVTNNVNFILRKNLMLSTLTSVEVYETIKDSVHGLANTQCSIIYGTDNIDGKVYVGIPTSVRVDLTTFQMRRIKLAYIDSILNEA
jgi:hypothetical protein